MRPDLVLLPEGGKKPSPCYLLSAALPAALEQGAFQEAPRRARAWSRGSAVAKSSCSGEKCKPSLMGIIAISSPEGTLLSGSPPSSCPPAAELRPLYIFNLFLPKQVPLVNADVLAQHLPGDFGFSMPRCQHRPRWSHAVTACLWALSLQRPPPLPLQVQRQIPAAL